jgi:hypothetical protein
VLSETEHSIALSGRCDLRAEGLSLRQPSPADNPGGGSCAFIGRSTDGRDWRIKASNNPQGPSTLVAEIIAGSIGELIAAPVCAAEVMWIGEEHAGFKYCKQNQQLTLEIGYASASLEVPDVVELRGSLQHQLSDDNPRRQVGVAAVYDLCWGGDDQWLYQGTSDQRIYSHDHGLYLWSGQWWSQNLDQLCGEPRTPPGDLASLDAEAIDQMAFRLRGLTWEQIEKVLCKVPPGWPATDDQLVQLGRWLLKRAPGTADRLEKLKGGQS